MSPKCYGFRAYSVRRQARLDAEISTKLEGLAKTLHQKQAPILSYGMQWGIDHSRGGIIDQCIPASVHMVAKLVKPERLR